MPQRIIFPIAILILVIGTWSYAVAQTTGAHPGAVPQTGAGAVPQNIKPAALKLSDEQKKRIQAVLTTTHTETTLSKKSSSAQKDFKPAVGGKIPGGFHPDGIPQPLITEIPILKQYAYVKFNNQILIIDATSGTIVEVIPEA
jgi:hypothetical protein